MARKKVTIPLRVDEYSYRVQYSPDDQAFIGLVDEFPGLSAFANTLEGATEAIETALAEGLQLLAGRDQPIPSPLSRREYI